MHGTRSSQFLTSIIYSVQYVCMYMYGIHHRRNIAHTCNYNYDYNLITAKYNLQPK